MLKLLKRFLKYAGTSLAGTFTDTLVLWLLSDFLLKGGYWKEYIISPVISFQCAVVTNFLISYYYVWRDRTRGDVRRKVIIKRFFAYNLSCSAVFLIRLGIIVLIEKFSNWDVVICNLFAMCFSGLLNFTINNLLIFKKDLTINL